MTAFEQHLQSIGFIPHKEEFIGRRGKRELKRTPIQEPELSYFSTMMSGRTENAWVKDDKMIYFGLNIKDKPPTLISPRPTSIEWWMDDEMNKVLKNETEEDIFSKLTFSN